MIDIVAICHWDLVDWKGAHHRVVIHQLASILEIRYSVINKEICGSPDRIDVHHRVVIHQFASIPEG